MWYVTAPCTEDFTGSISRIASFERKLFSLYGAVELEVDVERDESMTRE
jgi:hypothetical protein